MKNRRVKQKRFIAKSALAVLLAALLLLPSLTLAFAEGEDATATPATQTETVTENPGDAAPVTDEGDKDGEETDEGTTPVSDGEEGTQTPTDPDAPTDPADPDPATDATNDGKDTPAAPAGNGGGKTDNGGGKTDNGGKPASGTNSKPAAGTSGAGKSTGTGSAQLPAGPLSNEAVQSAEASDTAPGKPALGALLGMKDATDLLKKNDAKMSPQSAPTAFDYDGEEVAVINNAGAAFSMWTRAESSFEVTADGIVIQYKRSVSSGNYTGFCWGAYDKEEYYDEEAGAPVPDCSLQADGVTFTVTVGKEYAGKAWPIAPVKSSFSGKGATKSWSVTSQAYLAIPAIEEPDPVAEKIPYTGESVRVIDAEGNDFSMWTADADKTTYEIQGNEVHIHYYRQRAGTYKGIDWGSFEKKAYAQATPEAQPEIPFDDDGGLTITVGKENCGYALPIAPIKIDFVGKKGNSWTVTKQAYLGIPADSSSQDDPADDPQDDPQDDPKEDTKPKTTGDGVKIYKSEDKDDPYGMTPIISYKAETDGKNITVTYQLDPNKHETYATKFYIGKTSEISKIKDCYERTKDHKFTVTVPYSQLGKRVPLVIYTDKGWKTTQYYLQIPSDPVKKDDIKKAEKKKNKDNRSNTPSSGGGTPASSAVDTKTGLADGSYKPDSFSWSGGTGRLNITCTKITVRNGQTFATLHFSSKNVTTVKANGGTYTVSNQEVEIPVELNRNQTISALTVAMSQPHWVNYNIYVGLAAALEADGEIAVKTTVGDQYEKLDETAPAIAGLAAAGEFGEAADKTDKEKEGDLMRMFRYKDEEGDIFTLIEVDMVTGTAREKKEDEKKEENPDEKPEEMLDEVQAGLYLNNVVKYLVVPEDKEVPVGLDKLVVIIRQPTDKVYVATNETADLLDELDLLDAVAAVGVEDEKDLKNENLKKAMKDKELVFGGAYDDLDAKTIIKEELNLALTSAELLPQKKDDIEDFEEKMEKLANRAVQSGMPLLVMRGGDEKNDKSGAEWIAMLGAVFGAEEKAEKVFADRIAEIEKEAA